MTRHPDPYRWRSIEEIEREARSCSEHDHRYEAGAYGVCRRCGGEWQAGKPHQRVKDL